MGHPELEDVLFPLIDLTGSTTSKATEDEGERNGGWGSEEREKREGEGVNVVSNRQCVYRVDSANPHQLLRQSTPAALEK